jgi:hypothetical protein
MLIAPPRPLVDAPVDNNTQPLLPDTDVPLLSVIAPDAPDDATPAD